MPRVTIKTIAASARLACGNGIFCLLIAGLSACAPLRPAPRPQVYDLGPGAVASPVPGGAALPAVVLTEVDAPPALDGSAVVYRLAYSDAQQLRPYALARWSMPPAQLVRQRMREHLGQRRSVLNPAQGMAAQTPLWVLHLELEEFSQLFDTVDHSTGLVRLRATLGRTAGRVGGQELVAQRGFVVQRPADGADAGAGVRALTAAVDAAIAEVDQWLVQAQAGAAAPPNVQVNAARP